MSGVSNTGNREEGNCKHRSKTTLMENNDQEIDRFKTNINLSEYAASIGYLVDPNRTTKNSISMKSGSDRIIITKNADNNHWIYFAVGAVKDSGTIIDFIQKRGSRNFGYIRKELRKWLGWSRRPKVRPGTFVRNVKPLKKTELQILMEYESLAPISEESPAIEYLFSRGIKNEIVLSDRLRNKIKTDEYDNVIFPHFDGKSVIGWEKKNKNFTGFPEGTDKSIWFAEHMDGDQAKVIVESGIEGLSYYALDPERLKNAWLISTAGAWGKTTEKMIKVAIEKYPNEKIILAFNNDEDGRKYDKRMTDFINSIGQFEIVIEKPVNNDWNLDLVNGSQLSAF